MLSIVEILPMKSHGLPPKLKSTKENRRKDGEHHQQDDDIFECGPHSDIFVVCVVITGGSVVLGSLTESVASTCIPGLTCVMPGMRRSATATLFFSSC